MFEKSATTLTHPDSLTQIVTQKRRSLEVLTNQLYVFISAAHKHDRLKMCQLFGRDVADQLEKEDFFLQNLCPTVDH